MIKKFLLSLVLIFSLLPSAFAAIDFDDADDCLTIASSPTLSSISIYIRFKVDSTDVFLVTRDTSGSSITDWWWAVESNGNLQFAGRPNGQGFGSLIQSGGSFISTGTEYSAVVTYTSGSQVLYVNGSQVNTNSAGGALESDMTLAIGCRIVGGTPGAVMDGIIREVAIWNTPISAVDAIALTNSKTRLNPLQISTGNLISYYAMDDGPEGTSADGDTILDLAGYDDNATGADGSNNTGLTWTAETVVSYADLSDYNNFTSGVAVTTHQNFIKGNSLIRGTSLIQ